MKRKALFWTLALLVCVGVSTSSSHDARADGGAYYDFYCRGSLPMRVYGQGVYLMYKPSYQKAGPKGSALQPGTCAWKDRGLKTSEPRKIRLFPFSLKGVSDIDHLALRFHIQDMTMRLVESCATDKNCVLHMKARKADKTVILEAKEKDFETYWLD